MRHRTVRAFENHSHGCTFFADRAESTFSSALGTSSDIIKPGRPVSRFLSVKNEALTTSALRHSGDRERMGFEEVQGTHQGGDGAETDMLPSTPSTSKMRDLDPSTLELGDCRNCRSYKGCFE